MIAKLDPKGGPAWIVGGSSGLGRALVVRMVRDGWTCVVSARREEELKKLRDELEGEPGRVVPWPLDATEEDAVRAAVAKIEDEVGAIQLAVLNAGTHKPIHAWDFQAKDMRALIELNLMAQVYGLEALLPRFIGRGRGQVAVVGSISGYRGLPSAAGYGLTKAGIINMCEALYPELDAKGVRIQVVNPGFVRTPLTDKNDFPMPFIMEPEDAAEAFYRGLQRQRFEIVFPRRLAYLVKLLSILPYALAFRVTRRMVRK